jgi:hypothetical protein
LPIIGLRYQNEHWGGGGGLRLENQEFKASLGYIVRHCLKKQKQKRIKMMGS